MSYSDSILEAMNTLVGDALAKQKNVKVIEAVVEKNIDPTIGLYSLKYLDVSIKAYSNNPTIQYAKDDKVYVLSQDGTLDGNLVIIGATMPYSGLYIDKTKIQYKPICNNIFMNINNGDAIELCTYQSYQTIDIPIQHGINFAPIFNHYLASYKTFCLSMNVRTDIKDPYQKVNGNYGIKLTIPMINNNDEEVDIEYIFDIEKMEGDPYDLLISTPQQIYYTFDENLTYNVTKPFTLMAFCKDFQENHDITEPDIFLTNISFYPVEVIDPSILAGNYLMLTASQGNYFVNDRFAKKKTITPTLFVDGKEVSLDKSDIYWFVEDGSITVQSQLYNSKGGVGWRLLNEYSKQETVNGATENVLDLSQKTIDVTQDEVKTSLKYKCVVIYHDDIVKRQILIENLNSNTDIKVELEPSFIVSTSEVKMTCTVTYNDDVTIGERYLSYIWSRYDEEENLIDIDFYEKGLNYNTFSKPNIHTEQYVTDIVFNGDIITGSHNVIVCSVFEVDPKDNSMTMLGSVQKLVVLNSSSDYYLSLEGSNKLYKYDSDGDSPLLPTYDGPITSIIHEIEPISFKIYKANGEELTEEEYNRCITTWSLPKNSMMSFGINKYKEQKLNIKEDNDFYYISKRGKFDIDYDISNTYNANKVNNAVLVKVEIGDNSQNVVTGNADIRFLKEGESGTNGTRFSALLTYNRLGYNVFNQFGIRNKIQFIYAADTNDDGIEIGTGKWYYKDSNSNLIADLKAVPAAGIQTPFEVEVYKDGSLIDTTTSYSVVWTMFDKESTKPYIDITPDGKLKLAENNTWGIASDMRAAVVQANIKVTDSSATTSDQVIYAYYPIEMTRILDKELESLTYVPGIEGGFDSVLYSTDGTNPKWDSTKPFKCYVDSEDGLVKEIYTYSWGSNGNLLVKEDKDDESLCTGTPIPKYDNGRANNYIYTRMYSVDSKLQPEIDKHQSTLDELLKDVSNKMIQYQELKNLIKVFDWGYDNPEDEEKEKGLQEEIDNLKKEKQDLIDKIANAELAFIETMTTTYGKDYELEISTLENSLNNYTIQLSLLLRDTFENVTNYDINNTQQDYQKYLRQILTLQNPIINGINYSALQSSLNILDTSINDVWVKIQVKSPSEEILNALNRIKDLPLNDNFDTSFNAIENEIIALDGSYKTLLDNLHSLMDNKIDRLNKQFEFFNILNELIKDYLSQYDNIQVAEYNLPIDYSQVTSVKSKALFNNNGSFNNNIQTINDDKNSIVSRDGYVDNYEKTRDIDLKELSDKEYDLAKTEKEMSMLLASRLSEIETWESNYIDSNDFLDSRANSLDSLTKALNALPAVAEACADIPSDVFDYETAIKNSKDIIYPELNKLYNLIAEGNVSDLVNIDNAKIIIPVEAIKAYLDESRIQENTTIAEAVNNYNNNIDNYNNSLSKLNNDRAKKLQNIYNKIKSFYEKDSYYKNNKASKETVKEFFKGLEITISDDTANTIANNINVFVDTVEETDGLSVAVAANKEIENLQKSLNTLLTSFYCEDWDKLYNINKNISSRKSYKDLILLKFFDIMGLVYKIKSGGECTLDIDGTSIALINKYNAIPTLLVENFDKEINKEIKILSILDNQQKAINSKITITHLKPIVFRLNTYEFSWLNGWDGNKLYLDEDSEYILAPQIGAGAKNEANQFIGITMGVKQSNKGIDSEIGLFGFSEKGQSIFLDAKTGKAQFGVSGAGRINIDPTLVKNGKSRALLYSEDFFTDKNGKFSYDNETDTGSKTGKGMLIDLSEPCIKFGSGGFWVDKDGNMHVGGTNQENIESDHQAAPIVDITINPTYIEGRGWVYLDGLTTFDYIETPSLYLDVLNNRYTYDIVNDTFTSGGNTYNVVTSLTPGVPAVQRRRQDNEYVYYYYNGEKSYQMFNISGLYEADILQKGLGNNTYHVYFDGTQNKYWYVGDSKQNEIFINKDIHIDNKKYQKYVRYNEKEKYYYFYEDDGTELRYFYDNNLGVYFTYDINNDWFYFVDTEGQFEPPKKLWIWDKDENSYFYYEGGVKYWMTASMSSLGGWRIGDDSIYSENLKMKIYSAYKNENGNPSIFASPNKFDDHSILESTKAGCYLGPDGLSIGDALRATNDKGVFIGKLSSSRKSFWRIYGNNNNSYIYYNAKNEDPTPENINYKNVSENEVNEDNKIYIGTDGVVIGNQFQIDINGSAGRREKGMVYIGDLEDGVYWRFHTARNRAYMFYDKAENGEDYASLDDSRALSDDAKDTIYIGTDGIRVGQTFMLRPGLDGGKSSRLGLIGHPRDCWHLGRSNAALLDGDAGNSYFYSNKDYPNTGKPDIQDDADISLLSAGLPISTRHRHDIYLGTDGFRIGGVVAINDMISAEGDPPNTRDHFRIGIMEEDFYIGKKDSNGNVYWVHFNNGGGGGSLPQAEDYSF